MLFLAVLQFYSEERKTLQKRNENNDVIGFRGERIVFLGPNTNTNTIRVQKFGRIRILFEFRNLSEYEYEY